MSHHHPKKPDAPPVGLLPFSAIRELIAKLKRFDIRLARACLSKLWIEGSEPLPLTCARRCAGYP